MFPTNYLSNELFQVSYPQYATRMFNDNAEAMGIQIDMNKTLAPFTVAFNAVVVGNTIVNFIPSDFVYPTGEHFLVCGIRGFQGANATLNATAWTAGITDALGMNGTFTMTNNGTQTLKNQRFTRFQPGTNWPEAGWFYLSDPTMWVAQTNMAFQGTWGTAPTTSNLNFSIELTGLKLI